MRKIKAALNVAWIAAVVAMVVLLVPQPIHADSDPAWYDTGWGYRNTITIDHNMVANTDQSDFAVLVNSIYPAWKDAANGGHVEQSDGGDILFTSSDGVTKLSHEIERYTSVTGELIAWVKVPTVSASSDTIIYIYYGNAVCADQWATDGSTWLSNYRGVWHFKEDPAGTAPQMKDSTSPANHGTTSGGMTTAQQVAAQIDGGLSYDGNDNVQMANESDFDFQSSSPFTIEYWAKPTTSNTAIQQPVSKMAEASPWRGYEVSHNNNNGTNSPGYLRVTLVFSEPATNFISVSTASATNLNDGSWHHYVYTYDGSGQANGVKIYEDGVSLAVTPNQDTLSGDPLNNVSLSVGSRNNTNRFYRGILDEVRVSATALTGDWIATEYNNQSSPATFYSIGSTELRSGPTLISPANHTLTNDNTVDLDWSEVDWASRYQVVVDNNADFSSPEYDPGWGVGWLPGYSYRKMITIDHTQVTADLIGFPVLVSISSDNDLRTTANGGYVQNSNGYDIVFSSSDCTTQLNHEIEGYAATTGQYVAWVRTDLSSTADTVIYMYYGKSGITSNPSMSSTWESNYVGVWHLKEDPSGTAPQMKDSTSGANHGTSQGTMTSGDQVSAKIDGGLDYDGTNDNVRMANESNFDFGGTSPFTIEYWAKPTGATNTQQIVSKMPNASPYTGYEVSHNNRNGTNTAGYIRVTLVYRAVPTTYYISVTTTNPTKLNDGDWHHYVYTYNGSGQASGVKIYEDGVLLPVTIDTNSLGANSILNNTPISFGSRAGVFNFYRGILDESRVSNIARGADWIATEFNNHNSPATFYSVGSAEPYVDPTSATTSALADGTYYWRARAEDPTGNASDWSSVWDFTIDTTPPTVTIEQAATQSDPTAKSHIDFTVVFSEPVADFASGDVLLSGTAGATTATVTGSGTTYNVAVSGMARDGTVIATIPAGVAHDAAGNANTASSSQDNEVTYMRPIGLVPTLSLWGAIASALLFCIMIVWLTKRGAIHRRATRWGS